jgi:hypothetical protein
MFLRRKPRERKEPVGKHAPEKELANKERTLLGKEPCSGKTSARKLTPLRKETFIGKEFSEEGILFTKDSCKGRHPGEETYV